MVQPLLPNWRDDIRLSVFPQPRTSAGGYAMASVDKGALDADGRPVNAPEPTPFASFVYDEDRVGPLVSGDGRVKTIGSKTAEAPNALDIQNAKSAVDNWLRVVAYQFQVAVKPFVNQVTMGKLEDAFQENLKKLIEANTRHVAQMYEGIIELRVRETVAQREKLAADRAVGEARTRHANELNNLRQSIDARVAAAKNEIRQQYVGFRERMERDALESVRESINDMLDDLEG